MLRGWMWRKDNYKMNKTWPCLQSSQVHGLSPLSITGSQTEGVRWPKPHAESSTSQLFVVRALSIVHAHSLTVSRTTPAADSPLAFISVFRPSVTPQTNMARLSLSRPPQTQPGFTQGLHHLWTRLTYLGPGQFSPCEWEFLLTRPRASA